MSWLEIHVFGSSTMGEGIVLKLPDTRYAVVDCCFRGDIADVSSNPMISFLTSRKVKRLAFVCLTHPHEDHFFGMSQILSTFQTDQFFRSAALTPLKLHKIIESEFLESLENGDTGRQKALRELILIDKTWNEVSKKKPQERVMAALEIYPPNLPNKPGFTITGISPCDGEIDAYEASLIKCLDKAPFDLKHNRISVGLLINCKKFNLVLGGDMEEKNWESVLKKFSPSQLASRLVKVSHHGSKTGNCDGLWEALSSGESKPIGVITGKSASGLPTKDMVQKLQSYTSELSCTHRQSLSESVLKSIVQRTLNASDQAIKDFLSIDLSDTRKNDLDTGFGDLVEVGNPIYGRCSYYFDSKGNLADSQVDEPCVRFVTT